MLKWVVVVVVAIAVVVVVVVGWVGGWRGGGGGWSCFSTFQECSLLTLLRKRLAFATQPDLDWVGS